MAKAKRGVARKIVGRRRGAVLEGAVLDAAWAELASQGYGKFTIDAVARRAGTSRPVLYRRWPTRAGLASAAIVRHTKLNPVTVPDLGNLRDEMCLLLRKFADRAPPNLLRLVFDMSADLTAENTSFADERFREDVTREVIERALRRGEVHESRITPRVLRVPLGLVMHEVLITGRPISDGAIAEIVDDVFLPLVSRELALNAPPRAKGRRRVVR